MGGACAPTWVSPGGGPGEGLHIARVALVTAMADLAPMVEPGGFTES